MVLEDLALKRGEGALGGECSLDGPSRCILDGDGCAEQRHYPIAGELIDGSLEAVHLRREKL